MDNITNRKIRKPLMERKRRARINQSLDELHQLLSETDYSKRGMKLEKADILEMTVQYLKNMKQNQCPREIRENFENLLLERYLLGFEKCIDEVASLVGEHCGINTDEKKSLKNHLKSCLQKFRDTSTKPALPFQKKILNRDKKLKVKENKGLCCDKEFNDSPTPLQGSDHMQIISSKNSNGYMILLISSVLKKCDKTLNTNSMWRPW